MGLDISWYRQLKPTTKEAAIEPGKADWWLRDKHIEVSPLMIEWSDKNFDGERATGLTPGFFTYEECDSFRAGSYGGYNDWRDQLAVMAHGIGAERIWRAMETGEMLGKPFVELIHFADNEGYIGPVVSAKLAKDFAEYQERADKWANEKPAVRAYWLQKYNAWRNAFEKAADGGFVEFH